MKGCDEENEILGRELIHNDAALALAAVTRNKNVVSFRENDRGLGTMLPFSTRKGYFTAPNKIT